METTTEELATHLQAAVGLPFTTTGTGSSSVTVQQGDVTFSGGGSGFLVESTATSVVAQLQTDTAIMERINATGSGSTVVQASGNAQSLSGGGIQSTPTGTTTYAWDVLGRLDGVTMPSGQQHHYEYDYRTRRIGLSQSAHESLAAKHTAVVFSGGLSLAEYESATEQTTLSSPGASTVRYVRGPDMGGGVGGLLYSHRAGASKYNLSTGRGDIVAQSDGSGELTWTASYEAYGKRTKETGSNADKQRANSKDEDPTGLLNEGFRYRDIETGVWLSRDPAGFVDGPNLYAYVKQNPWSKFDPKGLSSEWHHRLPQKHRERFESLNIDIDHPDMGKVMDVADHKELHKGTRGLGFFGDRYNEEWDGFFKDMDNMEKKQGPLTDSAKRQQVEDFLYTVESRPEYKKLLDKGANVPTGVRFKDYSAFDKGQKSDLIKAAWQGKASGVRADFVGKTLRTGKTAAKLGAQGLEFAFKRAPLVGNVLMGVGIYGAYQTGGLQAAHTQFALEVTNASIVQDTIGDFTENNINPAIMGRKMDAVSRMEDAVENGSLLLPE